MKKWWIGGGRTQTGLHFEARRSFEDALKNIEWYNVDSSHHVFYNGQKVAEIYQKNSLYKNLLEPKWVNYKDFISKRLLPDNAIFVIANNTLFIVEIKYQEVAGSVDEKLQTCDFKKKQYERLVKSLNLEVQFCYVLSEWFMKPEYRDVLNYIQAVGCKYFFWELPLDYLGLPDPR